MLWRLGPRQWQSDAATTPAEYRSAGVDVLIDLEGTAQPLEGGLYVRWVIADGPLPDEETLKALSLMGARMIRDGHHVAVRCGAGANRSSLLSGCILKRTTPMSGDEIVEWIRQRRPDALTNQTFATYVAKLKGKNSQ